MLRSVYASNYKKILHRNVVDIINILYMERSYLPPCSATIVQIAAESGMVVVLSKLFAGHNVERLYNVVGRRRM